MKFSKEVHQMGLLGRIQRGAHEGLKGPTFTMGSINFSEELLWKVTNDNAADVEAILRKAREDIIALLSK